MPRTGDGSLMLMQNMKILSIRFTLQRSDDPVPSSADHAYDEYDDQDRSSDKIPTDVKEGHFVVYAVNDAEPKVVRYQARLLSSSRLCESTRAGCRRVCVSTSWSKCTLQLFFCPKSDSVLEAVYRGGKLALVEDKVASQKHSPPP
ncbi:hypothetical protein LINPERPRIM_LOCUS26369 [Linum perenne]